MKFLLFHCVSKETEISFCMIALSDWEFHTIGKQDKMFCLFFETSNQEKRKKFRTDISFDIHETLPEINVESIGFSEIFIIKYDNIIYIFKDSEN